jgi:menaquinone-dependent protoporphyrinogen oxidase
MKVLAVFGSSHGQAESVLRRVAATLEQHGHDLELRDGERLPRKLEVSEFDAVVVAASIILGRHQSAIREFVQRHKAELAARPAAFISINGAAPESDPKWQEAARGYLEGFLRQTGWTPRWTATFAGALRYRSYGLVTRRLIKLISWQAGGPTDTSRDYEFTDWEAVDRFASTLATGLASAGGARGGGRRGKLSRARPADLR